MSSILDAFMSSSNQPFTFVLLCLALFRIYLEVISFKFEQLPLGRQLAKLYGKQHFYTFHRLGFFVSIGYFILFAPGFFWAAQ